MKIITIFLVINVFFCSFYFLIGQIKGEPSFLISAISQQKQIMLETLKKTCQFLSQETLTVQKTATYLGKIVNEPGEEMPIEVQPNDSSFKLARIAFQAGTNSPNHVEFVLADSSTLTIADLKTQFGNYRTLPKVHWNSPVKVMFEEVDYPNGAFTCTAIAEVEPTEQDINNANVKAVTLRRDVRLP